MSTPLPLLVQMSVFEKLVLIVCNGCYMILFVFSIKSIYTCPLRPAALHGGEARYWWFLAQQRDRLFTIRPVLLIVRDSLVIVVGVDVCMTYSRRLTILVKVHKSFRRFHIISNPHFH